MSYFSLNHDVFLVKGALRGALYDLNSGDVFSIDPASVKIIDLCEQGEPLAEVYASCEEATPAEIEAYLHQLQDLKIGKLCDQEPDVEKVELEAPPHRIRFVWLEVKENCNLACQHCYASSSPKTKADDELSLEKWEAVVEEIANLKCKNIQFIGGEPLLLGEGLFQLIQHARDLGFDFIELFTNATLLDEKHIALLKEYGVHVATSLYSKRPKVHDVVTGRKGSFDKTIKSIRLFQEYDVPFRLALVVMKANQDYVEETIEFFRELGSKRLGYDVVRPSGRGSDCELLPDRPELDRKQNEARFPQIDKRTFGRNHFYNSCWFGKLLIKSNGDVIPCVMSRDELIGNVRDSSLAEMLKSENLKSYWGLCVDKIEICQNCEYRYACRDCRPVALGQTGRLNGKTTRCLYDPYQGVWKSQQEEV